MELEAFVSLHALALRMQANPRDAALAQEAIDVLEGNRGFRYGAILLMDETGNQLVPYALSDQGRGRTFVHEDKKYVASFDIGPDRGITGWVASHGETVCVGDVRKDSRYLAVRSDIRSELCVPIKFNGRVLGVINFETPEPDAFDEADRETVETVAAQIGFAIELRRQGGIDRFTGAANPFSFSETLRRELGRAARHHYAVSLLLFEVDFFAGYRDLHGFDEAQACLGRMVKIASGALTRTGEFFARLEAAVFAVILPSTSLAEARDAAQRLRGLVADANIPHAGSLIAPHLTVSIGVVSGGPGEGSLESFMTSARAALGRAQREGGNRVA